MGRLRWSAPNVGIDRARHPDRRPRRTCPMHRRLPSSSTTANSRMPHDFSARESSAGCRPEATRPSGMPDRCGPHRDVTARVRLGRAQRRVSEAVQLDVAAGQDGVRVALTHHAARELQAGVEHEGGGARAAREDGDGEVGAARGGSGRRRRCVLHGGRRRRLPGVGSRTRGVAAHRFCDSAATCDGLRDGGPPSPVTRPPIRCRRARGACTRGAGPRPAGPDTRSGARRPARNPGVRRTGRPAR